MIIILSILTKKNLQRGQNYYNNYNRFVDYTHSTAFKNGLSMMQLRKEIDGADIDSYFIMSGVGDSFEPICLN